MMRNNAGGGILAPQSPRNEPRIWHFPSKTSKFGQIHVKFTQLFKRPLIGRSRRVHGLPAVGRDPVAGCPLLEAGMGQTRGLQLPHVPGGHRRGGGHSCPPGAGAAERVGFGVLECGLCQMLRHNAADPGSANLRGTHHGRGHVVGHGSHVPVATARLQAGGQPG